MNSLFASVYIQERHLLVLQIIDNVSTGTIIKRISELAFIPTYFVKIT